MLLYPHFLSNAAQYDDCEEFWHALWNARHSDSTWSTGWLRTAFHDGLPLRDGNPIFSAISRRVGRAVKVIQAEADSKPPSISAWMKKMEDEDGSPLDCLTIHCVLSQSTAKRAAVLLDKWLEFEGEPSNFDTD